MPNDMQIIGEFDRAGVGGRRDPDLKSENS